MPKNIFWAFIYTQKKIKVHINSSLEHHNSVSAGCICASRSLSPVFFSPILVNKHLSKNVNHNSKSLLRLPKKMHDKHDKGYVQLTCERSITGNDYFSWDPHLHNTYPLKYLLADTKPTDFGLSLQYDTILVNGTQNTLLAKAPRFLKGNIIV